MKKKLKSIIDDTSTTKGKYFDYLIQLLILLSLVCFSIETFPDNSEHTKAILHFIDLVIVVIFSIEYLLRIYVADNRVKYILSFYGLIDLMAILPFYLHFAVDLRALRIFRIFRVFRALKLIRYSRAIHCFRIAARIVKEEIILFFIISTILIFLSAEGIYYFENEAQPDSFKSIFHSLWWAIVTLTTVGYGDVYPITVGGKIFTFFVLIVGIGIITIPAGLVATALTKAREIEESEESEKNI